MVILLSGIGVFMCVMIVFFILLLLFVSITRAFFAGSRRYNAGEFIITYFILCVDNMLNMLLLLVVILLNDGLFMNFNKVSFIVVCVFVIESCEFF